MVQSISASKKIYFVHPSESKTTTQAQGQGEFWRMQAMKSGFRGVFCSVGLDEIFLVC
jgi:hypothetical protein